jgi:4-hydroxybenzoyl-CoA thioesterase
MKAVMRFHTRSKLRDRVSMLVSRTRVLVEFRDCDPANIVYFARYFHWFDQSTAALFRMAGLPLDRLFRTRGILIPAVDAHARYLKPSTYGDELMLQTQLAEWKTSSFVISHHISCEEILRVEGHITHVWVAGAINEPKRMQSSPLPPDVLEKLRA